METNPKEYVSPDCSVYELQLNSVICGSRLSSIDDVDYENFIW